VFGYLEAFKKVFLEIFTFQQLMWQREVLQEFKRNLCRRKMWLVEVAVAAMQKADFG